MKSFKLSIALLAVVSFNSNAALMGIQDYGSYLTDTTSGLDWLDATATLNMSYNGVSAQLGAGGQFEGWRYATTAELGGLLSNSGVTSSITDYGQSAYLSESSSSQMELIGMLGDTLSAGWQLRYGSTYCDLNPSLCPAGDVVETWGMLSDFPYPNNPSIIAATIIRDDDRLSTYPDFVRANLIARVTYSTETLGSYLVRSTVPEPSTLALFFFGMLGLWLDRKRKA